MAQYTWNSWPHATTKQIPYETIMGYLPRAHQPDRETDIPDLEQRRKQIQTARDAAHTAMTKQQLEQTTVTKHPQYQEGQKVWLEATNIKRPYGTPKLSPKRYGPFTVTAKIFPVAYKLQLPET